MRDAFFTVMIYRVQGGLKWHNLWPHYPRIVGGGAPFRRKFVFFREVFDQNSITGPKPKLRHWIECCILVASFTNISWDLYCIVNYDLKVESSI